MIKEKSRPLASHAFEFKEMEIKRFKKNKSVEAPNCKVKKVGRVAHTLFLIPIVHKHQKSK